MNRLVLEIIITIILLLLLLVFTVRRCKVDKKYFNMALDYEYDTYDKSLNRSVTILEFAKLQRVRNSVYLKQLCLLLLSIITLFFPIWFACTSVKVALGAELELCTQYNCDCSTDRMLGNNSLSVYCNAQCKNCKSEKFSNHEVKCNCMSAESALCVIPCNGTSSYGSLQMIPKFEQYQCMIIDEVYLYEETACYQIFGDDISPRCKPGYSCIWDKSGIDKCSTYCAWGKANSLNTWNYKASITQVDMFVGFDTKVETSYPHTIYTKQSIAGCKGKFAVVNNNIYCIDDMSDMPSWIKCTSRWTWTKGDLEDFVRQYAPPLGKCDAETHFYPTESRQIVYPSRCTALVTFSGISSCVNEEIPACLNGAYTYNEATGTVWITYSQYCRLNSETVTEASSTADTSGCNLDCTWTKGYGTGLNKSCVSYIGVNHTSNVENFKDRLTYKVPKVIILCLMGCTSLVAFAIAIWSMIMIGRFCYLSYKLKVNIPDPIQVINTKRSSNGRYVVKFE